MTLFKSDDDDELDAAPLPYPERSEKEFLAADVELEQQPGIEALLSVVFELLNQSMSPELWWWCRRLLPMLRVAAVNGSCSPFTGTGRYSIESEEKLVLPQPPPLSCC
mmetsp:Transcript_10082/g.16217  ORF Transcript_10082/g.16217 Transcript_10082/m.16217 type:complete len:108 (+) Transcript_10082:326-649(+)